MPPRLGLGSGARSRPASDGSGVGGAAGTQGTATLNIRSARLPARTSKCGHSFIRSLLVQTDHQAIGMLPYAFPTVVKSPARHGISTSPTYLSNHQISSRMPSQKLTPLVAVPWPLTLSHHAI